MTAAAHEFTSDQIVDGVLAALSAGDVEVVPGLLKLLAVRDPARAQEVLDVIEAGIAISRGEEFKIVIQPVTKRTGL